MHFSIKRTYWSGHARILELVRPLGITPARADLLRLVALYEETGIAQHEVIRRLGVSPPTISKMLKAMADKNWVAITRRRHDNLIHPTPEGLVLIAQAISRLILSGELSLRMAVGWGHGPSARRRRERMYRLLNRARRAFHDRAPFLHPWRRADSIINGRFPMVWEKRLDADDVDDFVDEDHVAIRGKARAPIAAAPIPRSERELLNIERNRRFFHDDLFIPGLPAPRSRDADAGRAPPFVDAPLAPFGDDGRPPPPHWGRGGADGDGAANADERSTRAEEGGADAEGGHIAAASMQRGGASPVQVWSTDIAMTDDEALAAIAALAQPPALLDGDGENRPSADDSSRRGEPGSAPAAASSRQEVTSPEKLDKTDPEMTDEEALSVLARFRAELAAGIETSGSSLDDLPRWGARDSDD